MAPPDLARDAPRTDVVQPVQRDGVLLLGREVDLLRADRIGGNSGERLHLDPPLECDQRFDSCPAPVAVADGVAVLLLILQQPLLAQELHDPGVRVLLRQSPEAGHELGHAAVEPDRGQLLEAVIAADLEIESGRGPA